MELNETPAQGYVFLTHDFVNTFFAFSEMHVNPEIVDEIIKLFDSLAYSRLTDAIERGTCNCADINTPDHMVPNLTTFDMKLDLLWHNPRWHSSRQSNIISGLDIICAIIKTHVQINSQQLYKEIRQNRGVCYWLGLKPDVI